MINKIGLLDYEKIEDGIRHYVRSSTNLSKKMALLKKSLLAADPNIIEAPLQGIDFDAIQHLIPDFVEDFNGELYGKIKSIDLINPKSLREYRKYATSLTKKYLKMHTTYCRNKHKGSSFTNQYDEIIVSRGFNNTRYYKAKNKGPDILSHYTSSFNDCDVFFERALFTSYSICSRTAENFMVAADSERRAIIHGNISMVDSRIFSSFIVSNAFLDLQYEILALPSSSPLYLHKEPFNEIEQAFQLTTETF
jgi:hypothetical protein